MIDTHVNVTLPGVLDLTCPGCKAEFSIAAKLVSRRQFVTCPLCAKNFNTYDGLAGDVRRRIYHAVRDYIEQRVYENQAMEREGYFEDRANIDNPPPA
jgi:hypothetical protein